MRTIFAMIRAALLGLALTAAVSIQGAALAQPPDRPQDVRTLEPFEDSAHHWYSINDEERVIAPVKDQARYAGNQVREIADNILLFQKANGGWPKNYDMQAILTDAQRQLVRNAKDDNQTTFDNGATHAHVQYLAEAFAATRDDAYARACTRGIEFMLSAQLPNGGWPQFYPDTSGYRRYVTFNDGAMIGVMRVLRNIATGSREYAFLHDALRTRVLRAYEKGVECILRCQLGKEGERTGWCQQHDDRTLEPRPARMFEPAAATGMESAEIVTFLMEIDLPSKGVINAVQSAVSWFARSRISGIRAEYVRAPRTQYQYHETSYDQIVRTDAGAPPLWARYYELETNIPLFCNRDGKPVYTLGEVDRERRTGYAWYTAAPAPVLRRYPGWQQRWAPLRSVLAADTVNASGGIVRDTSFTTDSAWRKMLVQYPAATPARLAGAATVTWQRNLVYAAHGYRHLSLDLCTPADSERGPFPVVLLIHGGGWRTGDRSQEHPMAEALAESGFAAVAVEYRLSGEAQYPAGVHDLKTAVRWIRAHAAEYHLRPDRVAAMGGSAGGTLAAILATTAGIPAFDGTGPYQARSTAVQAVVVMDGVMDFADSAESGKDTDPAKPSAGRLWFGATFQEKPEVWRQASPVRWVNEHTPPLLVINSSVLRFRGGRDAVISRLHELGVPAEVYEFSDAPHPFWLMHPWWDVTKEKVVAFLDTHLKRD